MAEYLSLISIAQRLHQHDLFYFPLFIASHLVAPAYVSYWSALHFYGFTEQVPLTTFVATTKKKRPVTFRDFPFRFVTVKSRKFLLARQTGGLSWGAHRNSQGQYLTLLPVQVPSAIEEQGPECG